ncbi:MAG: TonB-dependent receptor [Betaproteobacteria bacterium]|nr:TonB-dependent receptor [Betaproteobacteria bacterium]
MYPIHRRAAIAAAVSVLTVQTHAQSNELDTVVVSATRFAEADPKIPANVTVLTRSDLRNIPATNLPDLLKSVAGIESRPLYGPLGMDATVDIRGFGSTATSNTLVLVDGMRMNPVDMGSIIWSAIPLSSIERIEIVRGSGSVLYGDGATGGVINIVTNKSGKTRASIAATVGSHDYQSLSGEFGGGNETGYANLFTSEASTDGYRKNSQQDQKIASGRAGLWLGSGELFADYAVYHESAGLPGNRLSAAYRNDPRGTATPYDTQDREGYRIRPGISYRWSKEVTFEAEVGIDHQNLKSSYVNSSYFSDRTRDTVSFTPRVRWQHGLGNLSSDTVLGFDYYDSNVNSVNRGGPNQGASQTSSAWYLQNMTGLTSKLNLTTGFREQTVQQSANQDAYAAWLSPAMSGSSTRTQSAYDVGITYAADTWRVFGKTGTTFRFANTDELFGSDAFGTPVYAGDLRPQHGTIHEIGGQVNGSATSLRASLYRLDLTDEIGYDGALFANTNFAPTRRDGMEIEGDWKVNSILMLKTSYAYIDAKFREGAYIDKAVPLIPRHQGNLQAILNTGSIGTYSALLHYTGDRRYGSDFDNTHGTLGSYTTLDLQATWDFKPWQVSAKLMNVTDRKYSPFAGYSAYRNDTYYYPADGRALFVTGRYTF